MWIIFWRFGILIFICRILVSRSGGYEEFCPLGYNVAKSVRSQANFRRKTSSPFSGSKNKPEKETSVKQVASYPITLAHSSTLKMEATCSSELNTRHYILEYGPSLYFCIQVHICSILYKKQYTSEYLCVLYVGGELTRRPQCHSIRRRTGKGYWRIQVKLIPRKHIQKLREFPLHSKLLSRCYAIQY
jgi:hypothetical protein